MVKKEAVYISGMKSKTRVEQGALEVEVNQLGAHHDLGMRLSSAPLMERMKKQDQFTT